MVDFLTATSQRFEKMTTSMEAIKVFKQYALNIDWSSEETKEL